MTIPRILTLVSRHFGTTPRLLLTKGREEPRCTQRQIAIALAAEFSGQSNAAVARAFGRKDDQTVAHAVHAVGKLRGPCAAAHKAIRKLCAGAPRARILNE